eukprot:scaffold6152_cov99-Isochrysis_galbana.AAC.4
MPSESNRARRRCEVRSRLAGAVAGARAGEETSAEGGGSGGAATPRPAVEGSPGDGLPPTVWWSGLVLSERVACSGVHAPLGSSGGAADLSGVLPSRSRQASPPTSRIWAALRMHGFHSMGCTYWHGRAWATLARSCWLRLNPRRWSSSTALLSL